MATQHATMSLEQRVIRLLERVEVLEAAAGGDSSGALIPLPFFGDQTQRDWVRPALTDFTWVGKDDGAGAVASAADNANGLPLVMNGPVTNEFGQYMHTSLMKDAPATPTWTITVAMAGQAYQAAFGSAAILPLVLQSTAGKLVTLYWSFGAAAAVFIDSIDDSLPGTLPNFVLGNSDMKPAYNDYFMWFRVVKTVDETTFYVSPDGFDFEELVSAGALAFLGDVAKVGFGLNRATSGTGSIYAKLWSWIES